MHQHGHGDRSDTRGRARHRRAAALAMLVAAATVAGTLASEGASATITPGAPTMPPALNPGSVTTPLFPVRTVPAFATPTHIDARVRPYNGGSDQRFEVPTPPGSVLLWGDWNRDGAYTPAIYTAGHWVIYDQMIGSAPVPTREFDYGAPGDRPVVGDFNKDGRTDIGVVRGNVWLLRSFPSAGVTWRRFAFGRATDTPVVGDWDGDGRDGVGVRRGAHWYLLQQPKATPTYTFAFGRPTDAPVVGDWDGNGADTVGAVRCDELVPAGPPVAYADQEHEAQAAPRRGPQHDDDPRRQRPREPGTVPAPWPTPAGPNGAACATASSGVANRDQASPFVRPSLLLHKALPYDPANPGLSTDPVFQLRTSLLDSERYLLGAQYLDRWFSRRGERFTDVLARFTPAQQEYAVRRPAMAALTTAIAVATGAHNDTSVGRTKDEAIRYTDWLVRSVACDHVAVTPGGWGGGWQTAHWAMLAGEAAWLIWDRLTPQTREYVAQMIVYEADRSLTMPVAYWADANGTVVSKGDTHAEEDSWNAALLELAVDMMPPAPAGGELARARRSTSRRRPTRPSADIRAPRRSTASRWPTGSTGPTPTTTARSRTTGDPAPDYMTNIEQNWWAADFAGLAGRKAPVAAFHNARWSTAPSRTCPLPPAASRRRTACPTWTRAARSTSPAATTSTSRRLTIWGTRDAATSSASTRMLGLRAGHAAAWSARDALAQHLAGQQALVASDGTGDGRTYSLDPPTAQPAGLLQRPRGVRRVAAGRGLAGALREPQRLGPAVRPAVAGRRDVPARSRR